MRHGGGHRRRRGWFGAALGVLVLTGCSTTGPGPTLETEVRFYRDLWDATRPASYVYAVRHTCFCGPTAIGPVRVTVGPSGVTSREYVDLGIPFEPALADVFPDIDGLFDVLEDAIERDAHQIQVTWDETAGYPLEIYIDYEDFIADEEQGFIITELPEVVGQR